MSDTEEAASAEIDVSILTWLEEAIGAKALAYVLGCDTDSILLLVSGEVPFSKEQVSVLRELAALREQIPGMFGDAPVSDIVRFVLTQVDESGTSTARSLRLRAIGTEQTPVGNDDMECAFITLALDAYPALLLPPEADLFPMPLMNNMSLRVSSLLHQHPHAKAFGEAALLDPVLQDIFIEENKHSGYVAMVYRNTGHGSGLQLSMLPHIMLRVATSRGPCYFAGGVRRGGS